MIQITKEQLLEKVEQERKLDKKAEYISKKFVAVSQLLNKSCEGMSEFEEICFLAKVQAHSIFKADKLKEKRKGSKKYVS